MGEEQNTQVQAQERDDFGDAFAAIAAELRDPKSDSSAVPAAAAAAEAKAGEEKKPVPAAEVKPAEEKPAPAAEVKPAEEKPAPAAEVKPAEEKPAPAVEAKPVEPTAAELAAQLAEARTKLEELTQRVENSPPPEKPAPVVEEKPIYTAEEQALLKAYDEEWGTVSKGEELKRRAEYRALTQYIFDQVNRVYAPLLEYMETRSPRDQLTDILALVPDYKDVRDAAVDWAGKQPTIHKAAYDRIIAEGTPQEVADLIGIFKQATGWKPPAQAAAPAAVPVVKPAPAAVTPAANDPATSAALAALKPVPTGRTDAGGGAPDPTDFAGAFAEFARTGT